MPPWKPAGYVPGHAVSTGKTARKGFADPHFGEEISLVGQGGSGTIFFSNCNLRCVFCQNWPIAHQGLGTQIEDRNLAEMMLHLQKIGCHNINLVTPTHVMPHILKAIRLACRQGLRLPLVYNTSGYETQEFLRAMLWAESRGLTNLDPKSLEVKNFYLRPGQ